MYVTNAMAIERMKANHENIKLEDEPCVCEHTTSQILNIAGQPRLRANLQVIVLKEKDRLGHSFLMHGDEWLTEFMANLQLNGVSVRDREDIKRTIKNEARFIVQQAVAVMGANDGEMVSGTKNKATQKKLQALFDHCDEIKARMVAQGEDEEAVETAIQAVLRRKFSYVLNPLP